MSRTIGQQRKVDEARDKLGPGFDEAVATVEAAAIEARGIMLRVNPKFGASSDAIVAMAELILTECRLVAIDPGSLNPLADDLEGVGGET